MTEPYQVGDAVEYIPHECHAFNHNANNEYPWVIGFKKNPRYERNQVTGEVEQVEEVVELDEGTLHRSVLPSVYHAPDASGQRKQLIPLRPVKPWPAVVRGVSKDGATLDLDIESNIGAGMVTLHYDRVPVDESGSMYNVRPHSCRRPLTPPAFADKGGQ